jgi:hypothetical protein
MVGVSVGVKVGAGVNRVMAVGVAVAVAVSVGKTGGGRAGTVEVLVGAGVAVKAMITVGGWPAAEGSLPPRLPRKKKKVPTRVQIVTRSRIRPVIVINRVLFEVWLAWGAT